MLRDNRKHIAKENTSILKFATFTADLWMPGFNVCSFLGKVSNMGKAHGLNCK